MNYGCDPRLTEARRTPSIGAGLYGTAGPQAGRERAPRRLGPQGGLLDAGPRRAAALEPG